MAPKGALTSDQLDSLKAAKVQILRFLEEVTDSETGELRVIPRTQPERAPLSFPQLAHWNSYHQAERRSLRQTAAAMRIVGRLNLDVFASGVAEVVRRHDALHTKIIVADGMPVQEVFEVPNFELKIEDFSALSECSREAEVSRLIERLMIDPIDVSIGPLVEMRLAKLTQREHVMIVVMDHVVTDNSSYNIFWRDLFTAYAQLIKGSPASLARIPMQITDYAAWQHHSQQDWVRKHGDYWTNRLATCERTRFPAANRFPAAIHVGWATVSFLLDKDRRAALREWCRVRQTTLAMCTFAAYAATILRWCGTSDTVIQYEITGRVSPKLENSIGYFAAALSLRIQIRKEDTLLDLLTKVTDEYCQAYEHADFSYLEAQVPRPGYTRNTLFNWVPYNPVVKLPELKNSVDEITCSPVALPCPLISILERDTEPLTLLYDTEEGMIGTVYFQLNQLTFATMERFTRNYLAIIERLLRHPDTLLSEISLV